MSITGTLPDSILNLMDPATRKRLGKRGQTVAEAIEKAEIKSERDLQNQIASWLSLHNIWFTRSAMNKRTTNAIGTPDFILSVDGKAIAFEVKYGTRKPDPEQSACMSDMLVNGWRVEVVRSLEEVKAFLESWGMK